MNKIKNWTKFNESFDREVVFYKLVDYQIIESILEKGLVHGRDGGTWLIAEDNISDWLKPNNLFGSMLQALLYFPSRRRTKVVLLRIKTRPNSIKVRNVDLMLKDMIKWKESIFSINDFKDIEYNINEYLLIDNVGPDKIEIVNIFSVPLDICKFKIEPNSLKRFIFGLDNDIMKKEKINTIGLISKFIFLKIKKIFRI